MSDFTTDPPNSNGPAPLGSGSQSSPEPAGTSRMPRFAQPPSDQSGQGPRGEATAPPGPEPTAPQPASPRHAAPRPAGSPAPGPEVKGRIHIADEVVEKVAALAAIEVEGVADLGGDFERAVESVRERIGIGNKRGDQGVKAEVKGSEVAISVTVMVEFGHVVLDVARRVQRNVAAKTQRMLGLKVLEVNVTVDDVATARREDAPDVVVTAG